LAQLPFTVTCGNRAPTVPTCPAGFHTELDVNAGVGTGTVQYGATQVFNPCRLPVIDTKAPPNRKNSLTWSPTRRAQGTGVQGDAADPYIVNPGSLPLPPHCYGWDGSSDYNTLTYYSLPTTILQVIDDAVEFGSINRVQVTVDYDVRTQRTFDQRKLVFKRANFGASFDFTTPDSDTCSNLSNSDVTVHHTDVAHNLSGSQIASGTWNSYELQDKTSAFKQSDSTFLTTYAWNSAQWKDSSYLDPAIISDYFDTSRWGRFSLGYNPANGLEYWAIYKFGQEIVTVSNVRFTVNVGWVQYHCTADDTGGGGGPCNCNGDCAPCSGGTTAIGSGKCATMCANSASSDTLITGWTIKDKYGHVVASNGNLNGWGFSIVNTCSLAVCVPCLTAAQLAANDYQGPYTVTWGSGQPCICNGTTKYKIYTANFTIFADVICDQTVTPKAGVTVSYDVSDARRHVRAFTTLKKDAVTYDKVHVGLASNVIPLDWLDITTDITAKRFCIRWDRQSTGSTLYGLAEGVNVVGGDQRAGQIHLYQSDDEGQTWQYKFRVDEDKGPNIRPVILIARDGRRFCFWFKQSAAAGLGWIMQKVYDSAWNVSIPTKVLFDNGADDDFNIDERVGKDGQWSLSAWYTLQNHTPFHPTGFAARDGRLFSFFNNSGNVTFFIQDGAGASIQGTRTAQGVNPSSDQQIAVDETIAADGNWYMTALFRGADGNIVTRSSRDGVIYS
jgi:hypothetical protein